MFALVLLLVVGVIGFGLLREQSRRRKLVETFSSLGFYSDPNTRNAFISSKTGIRYFIQKRRRGKHSYYYHLSAFIPINMGTRFTITKRGFFSQLLGINQGDIMIDDRLRISSPYPKVSWKKLTRKDFLDFVDWFFSLSQSNRSKIEAFEDGIRLDFYTKLSNEHVVRAVLSIDRYAKDLLEITEDVKPFAGQEPLLVNSEQLTYKCDNCGRNIPLAGDYCPFCHAKAPTCIVCRNDPEPNEDVVILACCQTYAHRDHLQQWFRKNEKCPYCNRKNPLVVAIPTPY